jgi:DNA polymerase V
MTTDLVVADPSREKGTICLAVSPSLKAKGVKNRCRVFEIPEHLEYIMAPPRMKLYIDYSTRIYKIYLKYISKDDIQVYSIDEAFLDVTTYLKLYNMDATTLGKTIIKDIWDTLGIGASCGIGTNLYLTKIALDITAKHSPDWIGYLDEEKFKAELWFHEPLTDFWRIGRGTAKRLAKIGISNMYEIAHGDYEMLKKLFGKDVDILIDHAWGRESTTIADIKSYKTKSHSLSNSQVLMRDYAYDEARLILKEMVELQVLKLVEQRVVTNNISLYVTYSKNIKPTVTGSTTLSVYTNSLTVIKKEMLKIYERIADTDTPIRKIGISCNNLLDESYEQYDLFTDPKALDREKKISHAVLNIKGRYGKSAVLKGMNLLKEGTTRERLHQIGGHKSGE